MKNLCDLNKEVEFLFLHLMVKFNYNLFILIHSNSVFLDIGRLFAIYWKQFLESLGKSWKSILEMFPRSCDQELEAIQFMYHIFLLFLYLIYECICCDT